MAMATTNDILGSILSQIKVTNKYVGDIAKSKSNPSMDALTNPVQSPTPNLSKETSMGVTEVIKTLGTVSIKDMAKISVLPIEIVARKINNIVTELNKIKPEDAEIANTVVKSFDTITKSIMDINSVKLSVKLTAFPEKQMLKFIDFVGLYIKKINKLPKQFSESKKKSVTEAMTGIETVSKNMLKTMGKVAILGISAPIMLPLVTLGFATIGIYLSEYNLMNKLVSKIGGPKETEAGMNGLKNIKEFGLGVLGIIGSSLLLGVLMIKPETRMIMAAGFGATMAVIAAVGILQATINLIGNKKSTDDSKSSAMNIIGFGITASFIALSSIGIGLLLMKTGIKPALYGLGAIGAVMVGLTGISFLMQITGKAADDSKKSVVSIIALSVSSILITTAAIGIGALIEATGDVIWKGLGAMGAVIGGFTAIGLAIGGVTKSVGMKNIIAGNAVVLAIAGMSMFLTSKTIDLGIKFESAGGWKTFGKTLGGMAALVGGFAALITGFGALMLIPGAGVVVAAGTATMLAIGGSIMAITSAASAVIDYQNKIPPTGMDGALANITEFVNKSRTILEAVNKVGKDFNFISIGKVILALKGVVWTMGSFTDILQKVGGKDGFIKSVSSYDENGNPVYGEDIDVVSVSSNLANSFSVFINTIFNGNKDRGVLGLNDLNGKEISAKILLKVGLLMNPISKFATLIQTVGAEKGKIRTIIKYDENGNPVYGDSIEIGPIAENISSSFAIFAQNVLTGINDTTAGLGDLYKAKIINELIDPINTFANVVKEFNVADDPGALAISVYDESGKLVSKETVNIGNIGERIATGFSTFATKITEALGSLNIGGPVGSKMLGKSIKNLISPVVDSVKLINDSIKEPDVAKFTKSINEIGGSIDSIHKLYVDPKVVEMNKTLPELTKKHTEYINKIAHSMKDAKSPMQKYREELERIADLYSTMRKEVDEAGNITLSVVEDNSTKYETNFGDMKNDIIEEMAQRLASMITAGFADVLNNLSMDIPNMMREDKAATLTADFGVSGSY